MNNCSNVSDTIDCSRCRRVVNADALSGEEWAYLYGLYFADGYMRNADHSVAVEFSLAEDEVGLAQRVAAMFMRLGLDPGIRRRKGKRYIVLRVGGKQLLGMFPDKKKFLSLRLDDEGVRSWVEGEGLNGTLAVPFIAGLLDGDGCFRASYDGRRLLGTCLMWSFVQAKYPFLCDFISRYVGSLAAAGVTSTRRKDGESVVYILASGRDALLRCSVTRWSFKAARWLDKYRRIEKEISDLRSRFLTPNQVAKRLHVDGRTVSRWCERGIVKHMLVHSIGLKVGGYYHLIPVEEVERLRLQTVRR